MDSGPNTVLYEQEHQGRDDTHAALEALKGDDETFDELLTRLLEERRESVRDGAGFWEGSDAAEKAREAREELKEGVGSL